MDNENTLPQINLNTNRYTLIENTCKDLTTVRILKQLLNSRIGEYTLVAQYYFQHIILENINRDISEKLLQIITEKLNHTKILSKAIISFGGVPKYNYNGNNFWNARFVNYDQNLNTLLTNNINKERLSIITYNNSILKIKNQELKQLLFEIIADKQRYIQTFTEILASLTN